MAHHSRELASPIDVAEAIAEAAAWDFERISDEKIAFAVEGKWQFYSLTLAWTPNDSTLRIICTFAFTPPEENLPRIYEFLNLANDKHWHGAFTFWKDEQLLIWRYGLVTESESDIKSFQIESMIQAALNACEQMYPAFQLAAWNDDTTAAQALKVAINHHYCTA